MCFVFTLTIVMYQLFTTVSSKRVTERSKEKKLQKLYTDMRRVFIYIYIVCVCVCVCVCAHTKAA